MPGDCHEDNWEAEQLPPIVESLNEERSQFSALTCPFCKSLHIVCSVRGRGAGECSDVEDTSDGHVSSVVQSGGFSPRCSL